MYILEYSFTILLVCLIHSIGLAILPSDIELNGVEGSTSSILVEVKILTICVPGDNRINQFEPANNLKRNSLNLDQT